MAFASPATLPTGRPGRLLALGLTLAVLVLAWMAVGGPLLDWYADRANQAEAREALAGRMEALVATLPALRQAAAGRGAAQGTQLPALLDGATDAVAAAALQERVNDMAVRSGATLSSLEVLPAQAKGPYREVGVRIAFSAPWPVLVRLLDAVAGASPRMMVDELQVRAAPVASSAGAEPPLDASLAVLAFRAGGAR